MNEKEMLEYMKKGAILCQDEDVVDSSLYDKYGVKRGLRDLNGHGVLTGVTNISKVVSSKMIDGKEVFCDGELWFRLQHAGHSSRIIYPTICYSENSWMVSS